MATRVQLSLEKANQDLRTERDELRESYSARMKQALADKHRAERELATLKLALYGKPSTDSQKRFALGCHALLLKPATLTTTQARRLQGHVDNLRAYLDSVEASLTTTKRRTS